MNAKASIPYALSACLGLAHAGCKPGGDERAKSTAGVMTMPESADAKPTDQGSQNDSSGSNDDGVGTDQQNSSTPLGATAKSLEQCTSEHKAWIAVIDGGAKPAVCGEPLVTWCCTREEALARFPTLRDPLTQRFDAAESEGFKLYHCSSDGKKTTFHFAQIFANGAISYRTHGFSDVFPIDTGDAGGSCQTLTTDDLRTNAPMPIATPTTPAETTPDDVQLGDDAPIDG